MRLMTMACETDSCNCNNQRLALSHSSKVSKCLATCTVKMALLSFSCVMH